VFMAEKSVRQVKKKNVTACPSKKLFQLHVCFRKCSAVEEHSCRGGAFRRH
jgi:hypothetical protein